MKRNKSTEHKEKRGAQIKFLSVFLCIAIFLQGISLPSFVWASEKSTISENGVNFIPEIRYDFCEIDYSGQTEGKREYLPQAYNSLSQNETAITDSVYDPLTQSPELQTDVRNQGDADTCWAFSTMGAMEIAAIKQGITDNTQQFSPYHFTYFLYNHVPDALLGTQNDTNTSVYGFLNAGGNLFMSLFNAANQIGPAAEERAPYEVSVAKEAVLDDSLCYEAEAVLKNGYMLTTGENQVEDIKQAVVRYGAVAFMYQVGSGNSYVNMETGASYCPNVGTNHAAVIVGWDDTYPVENFKAAYRPNNPGAWIIKNSWGSEKGREGYFYVSYEDKSIAFPIAVELMEEDTYDNCYLYDGALAATDASVAVVQSGGEIANVFTAHASKDGCNEDLQAVQIALQSVDVKYELSIYKNLADETDPKSGTLLHKQSGQTNRAGIYTIELDESLMLEANDTFSIVFTLSKEDATEICVWAERDYDYGWCEGYADIKSGQSFRRYSPEYTWTDLSKTTTLNTVPCLARIKAFTDTLSVNSSHNLANCKLSISENSYVADGNEIMPKVLIQKGEAVLTEGVDYKITYQNNVNPGEASVVVTGLEPYYGEVLLNFRIYESEVEDCKTHTYTDGICSLCGFEKLIQEIVVSANTSVHYLDEPFLIKVDGNKDIPLFQSENEAVVSVDAQGLVTIAGVGTTTINITVPETEKYKMAEAELEITVLPAQLGKVEAVQNYFEYDGEGKYPEITVYNQKGQPLTAYKDYATTYQNNVNPGTAVIQIQGIGNYTGSLLLEFQIIKRKQLECEHSYKNGLCKYCDYSKQMQTLTGTFFYEKAYSKQGFYLDMQTNGDGKLLYQSDNPEVVSVTEDGYVLINGVGSAYITVTASDTNNFYETVKQVAVEIVQAKPVLNATATKIKKTYGSKAFVPDVRTDSDGKLSYKTGNSKVAVVKNGKIKIKGYGKTTITITVAETEQYLKASKKVTVTVVPKKATIKKLKPQTGAKIKVTWKKQKTVSGYQIQYATDKDFKKNVKKVKVASAQTTSKVLKGLEKQKQYYIKVRAYKVVKGKIYYGTYSTVKKVKVK